MVLVPAAAQVEASPRIIAVAATSTHTDHWPQFAIDGRLDGNYYQSLMLPFQFFQVVA